VAAADPSDPEAARAPPRRPLHDARLRAGLWLAPSLAQGVLGRDHPFATALGKHFPRPGVALLAASLLFVA
jgi:hypothetical protein